MTTRRARRGEDAQALAEFAVVAPLLLTLLVGAAQVGVIYYTQVTVDNSARAAVRLAAELPNGSQAYIGGVPALTPVQCAPPTSGWNGNPVCVAVRDDAKWVDSGSLNVAISAPTIPSAGVATSCTQYPTAPADGWVSVTVTDAAPVFVPLLGNLFDDGTGHRTLQATVTSRLEPCGITKGN